MKSDVTDLLESWPVEKASAAVIVADRIVASGGDRTWQTRIASVSKLLTTYAGLVAVEERTIALDDPAGRDGATVRHLLAHAAGYAFDDPGIVADVGSRRVYSNTGIEVFTDHLAQSAGMPFAEYLREAVLEPLAMDHTALRGSPAHGIHSTVADLATFAHELMNPRLIDGSTRDHATSVQFPSLAGVLPGIGRYDPNPWGLGFEIKGDKNPHWSGTLTSPATYGHFGGAGTFMWIDPVRQMSVVMLANREFDDWAMATWPHFNDDMIRRFA